MDPHNVSRGAPFSPPEPTVILVTDSSIKHWGHLGALQAVWISQEASFHINILELHAVHGACEAVLATVKDHAISY